MSTTDLQSYYARRVAEYDRIYEKPERQTDLTRLRDWTIRNATGRRVLELACGTAYWTSILSGAAKSVFATDATPNVLDAARSRPLAAPERVTFGLMDAWHTGDLAGRFDAVFAAFWWSHIPRQDLRRFLDSLSRAVGPGVRLLFMDNRFAPGSSTPISETDPDGNTWQIRTLDDGSSHRVLKNFPTAAELRAAVASVGRIEEILELQYYWFMAFVAD